MEEKLRTMEKAEGIVYERLYVRRSSGSSANGKLYEISETIKELPSAITSGLEWANSKRKTRRRGSVDNLLIGNNNTNDVIEEHPTSLLNYPMGTLPRKSRRRGSDSLILSQNESDSTPMILPTPPNGMCRMPTRRRHHHRRASDTDLLLSGKVTNHLQELHKMALQKNAKNLTRQRRKDELLIDDVSDDDDDDDEDDDDDIQEPPKPYHGRRRRSDSNLILPSLNVKQTLTKRRLTPMPGVARRGKHVTFNDQDNHLVEYDLPSKCNSICEGQSLHDSLEQLNGPEITTSEKIERFLQSMNIHDRDNMHSD